jgi:lipopolysaccharide transport system ATP-binding protein
MLNNPVLRCLQVGKIFSISRGLRLWKIFFGSKGGFNGQEVQALRDINLEVPRGKIVGILGRNGAGKSTLLRLLGQIYAPTFGRIEVLGHTAGLFELGGFGNPNLTGRSYAVRYLRLMGVKTADLTDILTEIADFSELSLVFDRPIRTYSTGMAARLYFAVATAYQYEIYLIDELLSVGDEHFQAKCWRRMRERLLTGASGVLVTHDWTAIVRLCETACVIENGTFSFIGPSDQAVVSYLKFPHQTAEAAKFSDDFQCEYFGITGQQFKLSLPVEILLAGITYCAISIETLRIGIGWEIIILSEQVFVGSEPGIYQVDFDISSLPIVPGEYSLNLFLTHPRKKDGDVRSWTYGNGLKFFVSGDFCDAAIRIPFNARKLMDLDS